jgi:hypothetical protein
VYTTEEEADREREQETDETAASANIPRRLMLSIPSPAEIPFFKGRPEKGDPPYVPGTPDTDVDQWLRTPSVDSGNFFVCDSNHTKLTP